MAAASASGENQIDDVTECPICTEVYTDPRSLPCIHTYCLKCIEKYSQDKEPGDSMACSMCRNEFTIPDSGVSGLPKNFFIEKLLLQLEHSSSSQSQQSQPSPCEVCSSAEETDPATMKQATKYCVECDEKLCWEKTGPLLGEFQGGGRSPLLRPAVVLGPASSIL